MTSQTATIQLTPNRKDHSMGLKKGQRTSATPKIRTNPPTTSAWARAFLRGLTVVVCSRRNAEIENIPSKGRFNTAGLGLELILVAVFYIFCTEFQFFFGFLGVFTRFLMFLFTNLAMISWFVHFGMNQLLNWNERFLHTKYVLEQIPDGNILSLG